MSFTMKLDLSGERNKENLIAQVLKGEKGKRIEEIKAQGEILEITFSHRKVSGEDKKIVKQFSKAKNKDGVIIPISRFLLDDAKLRARRTGRVNAKYRLLEIIEFKDVWLAFFEEK